MTKKRFCLLVLPALLLLVNPSFAGWKEPVSISAVEILPGDGTPNRPASAIVDITPAIDGFSRYAISYGNNAGAAAVVDALIQAKVNNRQVRLCTHTRLNYTVTVHWYEGIDRWESQNIPGFTILSVQ